MREFGFRRVIGLVSFVAGYILPLLLIMAGLGQVSKQLDYYLVKIH
jgi:hypothetical protein